VQIVDERHADHPQPHDFSDILADGWMSRALDSSC
jgi:hypothetical protein